MASSSTSGIEMHPLAQQYTDEYNAWLAMRGQRVGMFPGYREWGFNQAFKLYDELQNLKEGLGLNKPLFPKEEYEKPANPFPIYPDVREPIKPAHPFGQCRDERDSDLCPDCETREPRQNV